jgi:hypothetical protein
MKFMLPKLQAFVVFGVCAAAVPAAAEELTDAPAEDAPVVPAEDSTAEPASAPETSDTADAPTEPPPAEAAPTGAAPPEEEPAAEASAAASFDGESLAVSGAADDPPPAGEAEPGAQHDRWETFVSGYFRAPFTLGVSPRPGPDDPDGPAKLQLSYGPTRTIDASYYSFAYTRLQEQDWAELFVHAKKDHVEGVVGWMGYWYQGAGFRNPDAGWAPGMAYLRLDSDFEAVGVQPNIALTAGAFWPSFGHFEKYDTYTLGRFRHLGEQLKLTVPVNPDLEVSLVHGFGGGRDGSFIYQVNPPIYGAKTGIDLLTYANLGLKYKEYVDLGLHFNYEWTSDPNLFQQAVPGKSYADARKAMLQTVGAEVTLAAPYAGSLWLSPSLVTVKNGWALGATGGTEVMHSQSGEGLAANYLAWTNSPNDSTGSGSLLNVGFLYENSLSGISGKPRGSVMPEVTLNVFGLYTSASLDLPEGSVIPQDTLSQFKYGADVEVQPLDWLGIMLRWDEVNYDLESTGYVFSSITSRLTFSSHFLSSESIYLQYSRYRYGDRMVLAGTWPWGTPLVAGSDIIQGGTYADQKPDMDVIKIQASIAF